MKFSYSSGKSDQGFTLIEILIALLVAGVGILAALQLQSVFLESASSSEKRSVAVQLAEKEIERLRDFDGVYTTVSGAAGYFEDIAASTASQAINNVTYRWVTSVVDYKVQSDTLVVSSASPELKELTINVYWDGASGACASVTDCVSMTTYIGAIDPSLTALAGAAGGIVSGGTPTVSYNRGEVPDVVPISIGEGVTQETSKPLPDVDQSNESTEVQFETVTYDTSSNKQEQEEFLTINCVCTLEKDEAPYTKQSPYHYKYNVQTQSLDVEPGQYGSSDESGSVYGQGNFTQSEFCDRCCEGHHDPDIDYSAIPHFQQSVASVPHPHYKINSSTGVLGGVADTDGDTYAEACRFRRVDGIFRLFPDWHLIALPVFSYDYGASSAGLASYQDFVGDRIKDEIYNPLAVTASLVGTQISPLQGSLVQMLARGIYLDDMSYDTNWVNQMASVASDSTLLASKNWLEYTPFQEINMTLLADWSTDDNSVATVTNEDVNTVVDDALDYYGVYSRGLVSVSGAYGSSTQIEAVSKTDNTGILGNRYGVNSSFSGDDNGIIPSPFFVSGAVSLAVADSGSTVTLAGTVSEDNTNGNVTVAANKTSVSTSVGSCNYTVTGGVGNYNCVVAQNSGNITIYVETTSNNQYMDPDGVTVDGSVVVSVSAGGVVSGDGSITVNVTTSSIDNLDFAARHD